MRRTTRRKRFPASACYSRRLAADCQAVGRRHTIVGFSGRRYRVPTQTEKGITFRALHDRDGAFVIPNPWDIGTARLLARLGFEALATTSAGYAFSVGKRDNTIGRDEM